MVGLNGNQRGTAARAKDRPAAITAGAQCFPASNQHHHCPRHQHTGWQRRPLAGRRSRFGALHRNVANSPRRAGHHRGQFTKDWRRNEQFDRRHGDTLQLLRRLFVLDGRLMSLSSSMIAVTLIRMALRGDALRAVRQKVLAGAVTYIPAPDSGHLRTSHCQDGEDCEKRFGSGSHVRHNCAMRVAMCKTFPGDVARYRPASAFSCWRGTRSAGTIQSR